jgi:predicted DNA-binding ribbon-helix-helix protein
MIRRRARAPSAEPTPAGDDALSIAKHSLVISGHSTSVSLERVFWEALKAAAAEEGCSLAGLVARIDAGRGKANLSSALRVYAMERALGRNRG